MPIKQKWSDVIAPYTKKWLAEQFGSNAKYFTNVSNDPIKLKHYFTNTLRADKLRSITGFSIEEIDFTE